QRGARHARLVDRRRHQRDPAQHHRRAGARPAQGPGRGPRHPVQPAARRHHAEGLRKAMALILTDDEEQFRDSVRRVVAERSPLPKLRELMSSGQPFDADVWKQLSELGLAGLIIPEEHGGAAAGYSVLSVALGELGAGLVASPLLAGTLAAGTLLRL